ncbi:bacterioferritin-associated ferredoxin [Fontimonas thermophila]|uniref:Bacterioferritin-associated ferredoxin n=1 Tax=Fontimonas thermophila TaxID=1076937 RepID=A0A1I2J9K4_9GAMM|nr:(2Fe-2S)-binding protein [Fontimonas thermophila]SFF51512.1 bacterioferritin-associated ferredoxin [Fontimonas thermophila]
MIICVCKAVSERTIRRAVREDGIVSLRELSRECGLGTCCGKCVPLAREVLAAELAALGAAQVASAASQVGPASAAA